MLPTAHEQPTTSPKSNPKRSAEERRRQWYSIEDVAARWDMSKIFVQRLVWRGDLTARKFGRFWRITAAEVERYEALRPTV